VEKTMKTGEKTWTGPPAGPVERAERMEVLDILRGFAVLGILVMNIQAFAMVDAAYLNPTVQGDLAGVNLAVWLTSHVFADMKFMTIFSMLFGAGIVLSCERVEQRGGRAARIHFRRTWWLLLFGLAHAYLLWTGDILVWYSFSAFLAWLFWRSGPGRLFAWGLLMLLAGSGLYLLFQLSLPRWPPEAVQGNLLWWAPPPEAVEAKLAAYRGGWLSQMSERVPMALTMHTFVYLIFGLWRTLGTMLAGMAFLKWGVLTAGRSTRFYAWMMAAGLASGLPAIAYGVHWNFSHGWAMENSMFGGSLFNYWGSLPVAGAYIAAVMLAYREGWLKGFQRLLAPVGRMAFTSYILQTLICTTIFYGHGFGLYGYVPRWGQALVVLGVWCAVVAAANAWLARFRFGPLEWLWRSLTYGARQPMRAARSLAGGG
jgi:uncharacterized protein